MNLTSLVLEHNLGDLSVLRPFMEERYLDFKLDTKKVNDNNSDYDDHGTAIGTKV